MIENRISYLLIYIISIYAKYFRIMYCYYVHDNEYRKR